jgi:hypothetical protein
MPYVEGSDTVRETRGAVYPASVLINAQKVTQGGTSTTSSAVALPSTGKQWPYIR